MTSFWQELRRRNVVKVAVAYAVLGWVVIQVASTLFPALSLPDWTIRLVAVLILLGFPIALILAWVYEITPEGVKKTGDVSAEAGGAHVAGHRLNYVIAGLLVVAIGLLAYDNFSGAVRTETTSRDTPGTVAPTTRDDGESTLPAIAVLNFVNGSSDPEQEYFVGGLSEQLRDTLSRLEGLAVVGSTSSTYFAGRDADLRTIGERLNVDHVLEGSIRKSGNALRISARLTAVDSGFQLWSDTYERTLDDVFELQDEIAGAVAEALQITLGVGQLGRRTGMTRNVAAYEEYVTALGLYREFQSDSIRNAVIHFERAITIDRSFAAAWAMLANAYGEGAVILLDEADEWRAKSREAWARAADLAPDWPLIALNRANELLARGDVLEAGRYFEDQLPLVAAESGNYGGVAFARGRFLRNMGKAREAIRELERARVYEPLSAGVAQYLAEAYADTGAIDAALAEFDRGLANGAYAAFLDGSALLTALASNDRAEIERRLAAVGPGVDDFNRRLAALLDDSESALRFLRARLVDTPVEPLPYTVIAQWAAYFGDPELALDLLQRIQARGDQSGAVSAALWRPVMRDVRRLEGFKKLVENLVPYWREYGWPDTCRPAGENDFTCE